MRTVAVGGHPGHHLKLPLPASTLGLRNRRSIVPATLADGALVGRTLAAVLAADADADADTGAGAGAAGDSPLNGLLIADETRYAHAGRDDLGYLLRRLPPGLDGSRIVPVAALTARAPGGQKTVFEELAGSGGVLAFARDYFRLVFDVAVRLLVRHGIALESHQQNAALVIGPGQPLRLLVKDFDGTLLRRDRVPAARDLTDSRMVTFRDDDLADVFVTITVHLCVGAVAFGLARAGAAPLEKLLAAARRALTDALEAEGDAPEAKLLRVRVLEADRLTGKSMITAGTLTAKEHLGAAKEHAGAADVNKFYAATGPNYLKGNQ
jgi:siderophore synthetase component